MKFIDGSVTAAKGFAASGIHCGIRKNSSKKDLALIFSDREAAVAAVYTTNLVKGAPLKVTKRHLENGRIRAVICNSGNANTCSANGEETAIRTCAAVAKELSIDPQDVAVASTGVIGQPLDVEVIKKGIPALVSGLSERGAADAAEAILTTDLIKKECAVQFEAGGKTCTVGGFAKGSGMINPNMATMLAFVTCDAWIDPAVLQGAVTQVSQRTFNRISVDGDTSTNDMLLVLCNGASGAAIEPDTGEYELFLEALTAVCEDLAKKIARDGEGATKLLICSVSGAVDEGSAALLAKSVIMSSLVKAAMFGKDANWGRIICALGYSGAEFEPDCVRISLASAAGEILVCENGAGTAFDEALALLILSEPEIEIKVSAGEGPGSAHAYGCDLTYDYVKINGDYRT